MRGNQENADSDRDERSPRRSPELGQILAIRKYQVCDKALKFLCITVY